MISTIGNAFRWKMDAAFDIIEQADKNRSCKEALLQIENKRMIGPQEEEYVSIYHLPDTDKRDYTDHM